MPAHFNPEFDPADVNTDYGSTGGDITVPTFTADYSPFKFWCQKTLPLVFDDSLSYYEVLCKLVTYVNNLLTDLQTATGSIGTFAQQFVVNQQFLNNMAAQLGTNTAQLEAYINDRMEDFSEAYASLQEYVNTYFANLDVQEEINTKLDEMAQDGTLDTLLQPFTEDWLENMTEEIRTDLAQQNQTLATQNSRISVLEGRMDTFAALPAGSTSGNAELLDIRTNFLGETFGSAGDAVRASDLIASRYIALPFTNLTGGTVDSATYAIDVSKYKGGRIAFIGNFFVNAPFFEYPAGTDSSIFRGNNRAAYSGSTQLLANSFEDFTYKIETEYAAADPSLPIQQQVRMMCSFTIPDDFSYQYLLVEGSQAGITGAILPYFIIYGTYWIETPIDPTLTQAGEAADAKATGDAIAEVSDFLDDTFTVEEHKSLNLLNPDEIVSGYYWTDGFHSNTSYNSTPYIAVTEGQKLWCQYGLQNAASRQKASLRLVTAYNSNKQIITAKSAQSVYSYEVTEGVSFVILSITSNLLVSSQLPVVLDQQEDIIQNYIPYFEPYTTKILKPECNNEQYIQSIVKQTIENSGGKLIFTATADSLSANTNLICCNSCCNKKNEYIELTANFSTFDALTIAHGKNAYMGGYITVTTTKIQCYSYDGTLYEEFEHGLTLTDFINVIIYTKNDSSCRSKITIMTEGGDYIAETTRYYSCRAAVLCNATFAMTNVKMQYVVNDGKENVWVFGDSYISLGDPNRWATQLLLNGHKNVLLCGFGGAMSANQIVDFRLMLTKSKPKYLCWFLGMNDGDTSSAVNANWKTYVDEVIETCDSMGITVILATIPNVPNVINTFKNTYVKETGKRYVDFAKAVNGESTGATWYTGMLSSDNTHPTALGAKALMRQFILDVPEVLYEEE